MHERRALKAAARAARRHERVKAARKQTGTGGKSPPPASLRRERRVSASSDDGFLSEWRATATSSESGSESVLRSGGRSRGSVSSGSDGESEPEPGEPRTDASIGGATVGALLWRRLRRVVMDTSGARRSAAGDPIDMVLRARELKANIKLANASEETEASERRFATAGRGFGRGRDARSARRDGARDSRAMRQAARADGSVQVHHRGRASRAAGEAAGRQTATRGGRGAERAGGRRGGTPRGGDGGETRGGARVSRRGGRRRGEQRRAARRGCWRRWREARRTGDHPKNRDGRREGDGGVLREEGSRAWRPGWRRRARGGERTKGTAGRWAGREGTVATSASRGRMTRRRRGRDARGGRCDAAPVRRVPEDAGGVSSNRGGGCEVPPNGRDRRGSQRRNGRPRGRSAGPRERPERVEDVNRRAAAA